VDLLLGVDEEPWCSEDESCSEGDEEPEEDHIQLQAKEEPGECGGDHSVIDVAVAPALAQSESLRDVLVEKSGGKGMVFSSYQPDTTKDMSVVDHLATIAAELSDPTLLWVTLNMKERMLRRTSKESQLATKACEKVLQANADETNKLRKRAAIDDKAKENSRNIDKFLKQRRPARTSQPPCLIGDPAKVKAAYKTAVAAKRHSMPVPEVVVLASAPAQGSGGALPSAATESYQAVHPRWRAKLKERKKFIKTTMRYVLHLRNRVVKASNKFKHKQAVAKKKGKAQENTKASAPSKETTAMLTALGPTPPAIPRAIQKEHKGIKSVKPQPPVAPALAQGILPPKELACRAKPRKADGTPDPSASLCGFMNAVTYKVCMQCGLDFSKLHRCVHCQSSSNVRYRDCEHCGLVMPYVHWRAPAKRTRETIAYLPRMMRCSVLSVIFDNSRISSTLYVFQEDRSNSWYHGSARIHCWRHELGKAIGRGPRLSPLPARLASVATASNHGVPSPPLLGLHSSWPDLRLRCPRSQWRNI
jgi:hypothetical protein